MAVQAKTWQAACRVKRRASYPRATRSRTIWNQRRWRCATRTASAPATTASCPLLTHGTLTHGTQNLLDHVHFVVGTPVKAMLAKPTNGVGEVLDRFADCEFTVEYKYDGERAQVWHLCSCAGLSVPAIFLAFCAHFQTLAQGCNESGSGVHLVSPHIAGVHDSVIAVMCNGVCNDGCRCT